VKRLFLTGIAVLLLATGVAHAQKYRGPTSADDPMYQTNPDIDRAEGLRSPKVVLTPEEKCNHHNREDGSWWHCMISEYKKLPCDIACQLSIHDR
jgi:hypothetical protein